MVIRVVCRLDDVSLGEIETKWELGEILDVMVSNGGVWGVVLEVGEENDLPPKFEDIGGWKHG